MYAPHGGRRSSHPGGPGRWGPAPGHARWWSVEVEYVHVAVGRLHNRTKVSGLLAGRGSANSDRCAASRSAVDEAECGTARRAPPGISGTHHAAEHESAVSRRRVVRSCSARVFIPLGVMVLAWLGSGGGRRASGVGVTVGPSAVSVLAVAAAGAVTGPPGSAACPDDVAVEAHAEPVLDLHRGRILRSSLATRSARSECTATVPSRRLSLGPPAGFPAADQLPQLSNLEPS